ncbi:MAG: ABC transporter ATP-binding protein [Anaerolineae bacterium]
MTPNGQFTADIGKMIWQYRWFSLAIVLVTIVQEISALWPVTLLGLFVDRLGTGNLGNVVWLLLGATLLYPTIVRGNVLLRHKMFYETDFSKRVEMTLELTKQDTETDVQSAGEVNSLIANAVSGITNATYHVLGSFTPVIIKIVVVSISLLAYNRLLGWAYLASLIIPGLMTWLFNDKMRVLRDAQYSVISKAEGVMMHAITHKQESNSIKNMVEMFRERKVTIFALLCQSQTFLLLRQIVLIGSQFLVVFLALGMRQRLNLTAGDFTRIFGYTAQVAAAFLDAAACLDAVISYSRTYHVLRGQELRTRKA